MTDDVCALNAKMVHQGSERVRLAGKRQLTCDGTTTRVPLAVVANDTMSRRESRFVAQGCKPVGASTMVNQHDVFTRANCLVFQLDGAERCSMHRCHLSSGHRPFQNVVPFWSRSERQVTVPPALRWNTMLDAPLLPSSRNSSPASGTSLTRF